MRLTIFGKRHALALAVLAGIAVLAAGCASDSGGGPPAVPQITGIALPQGYSIDSGKTILLGEGERWTGRLNFTINSSAGDMFDFYRRQMPGFGWSEIAVVRAETSVLTFSHSGSNRVATVQITARTLWGSIVEMVVSPAGGRSDQAPASPASPSRRVTAEPIR